MVNKWLVMAMGAAGAWCGSVWLATSEAETSEVSRENGAGLKP